MFLCCPRATASPLAGTSLVTTLPAPTVAFLPIVTGATNAELEQSSDMVVMVHRPDYDLADKENERAGEVDLYIAKNRSGPTAVVTLSSQLHYARFADMAQG